MLTGSAIWFLTLLSLVFISSNDAIKCYECNDCPDKGNLREARECTTSTLSLEFKSFFSSMDENKPMKAENAKVNATKVFEPVEILTCYKVVKRNGTEEKVHRGCSPYLTPKIKECGSDVSEEMCLYVCEEDECNSAPISHLPATITTFLIIALAFFIA